MLISDALKQQGILNGYDENQTEEESAIQKETDNVVNGLLSAAMSGAFQPEQQIVEPPQVNAMRGVGSTGSGPFQSMLAARGMPENGSFEDYFNIFNGPMPALPALFLAKGMMDLKNKPSEQIKPEWERYFQNFPEERAKYPKSLI